MIPPPPTSTLFPYTTLFRSKDACTVPTCVDGACGKEVPGNDGGACQDSAGATGRCNQGKCCTGCLDKDRICHGRSEEHTSELQSRLHLVCRLLLEKKNNKDM